MITKVKRVKKNVFLGKTFKLDQLGVYFFGKDPFISFFNVEKGILERAKYEQVSQFQGGLILPSVLYLKQHMSVLITGNSLSFIFYSGGAAKEDG